MDKTLLIGNGLNRTLKSSISWEDLLDDIANEYGVEHIDNLPMPLEFERIVNTILRKSSNPSSRIYNDIKKKIANKVQDIKLPADAIQHELCAIPVNAIITTNYDYLLENAYNQDFSYKDAKDKSNSSFVNLLRLNGFSAPEECLYLNFSRSLSREKYKEALKHYYRLHISEELDLKYAPVPCLLEDFLSWNYAALRMPIIYFTDNINQLRNNSHWYYHRKGSGDLLLDRNGNVVWTDDLINT